MSNLVSPKRQIEGLLGDETDNYDVHVSLLRGIQNMMHAPPGAKPTPNEMLVVFMPKDLTFEDEKIEPITGRHVPDKMVVIRGRPDAVLEVLDELNKTK